MQYVTAAYAAYQRAKADKWTQAGRPREGLYQGRACLTGCQGRASRMVGRTPGRGQVDGP